MTITSNLALTDFENGKKRGVKVSVADDSILIVFPMPIETDDSPPELASVMVEVVDGKVRLLYWKQSDHIDSEEPTIVELGEYK